MATETSKAVKHQSSNTVAPYKRFIISKEKIKRDIFEKEPEKKRKKNFEFE